MEPEQNQEPEQTTEPQAPKATPPNNALVAERQKVARLQAELAKFKEIDIEGYRTWQQTQAEKKETELLERKQWDKLKSDYEARVSEASTKAQQAELRMHDYMITQELKSAFYANGGQAAPGEDPHYYADTLASQLKGKVRVIDGQIAVVDADGNPTGDQLNTLFAAVKTSPAAIYFAKPDQGKGAGTSGWSSAGSGGKIVVDASDPIAVGRHAKAIAEGRAVFK